MPRRILSMRQNPAAPFRIKNEAIRQMRGKVIVEAGGFAAQALGLAPGFWQTVAASAMIKSEA